VTACRPTAHVLLVACLCAAALFGTTSAPSVSQTYRQRGAYLVDALAACGNCHTPHDATSKPIPGMELAGGREFDIEAMLVPKWQRQSWGGTVLCRNAPNDLVACIGSGYQRLYVIPSMNLVVVRHGNGRKFSDAQFLRLLLGR